MDSISPWSRGEHGEGKKVFLTGCGTAAFGVIDTADTGEGPCATGQPLVSSLSVFSVTPW